MSVQISFVAGSELRDALVRLSAVQMNTAARAIASYMQGELTNHFTAQTLWDDSAMPASKTAESEGRATLIQTGTLMDSYQAQVEGGDVVMGSNVIYAAIHDQGGDAGRNHAVHIDPRPILGVSPRNNRDIIDEITALVVGAA